MHRSIYIQLLLVLLNTPTNAQPKAFNNDVKTAFTLYTTYTNQITHTVNTYAKDFFKINQMLADSFLYDPSILLKDDPFDFIPVFPQKSKHVYGQLIIHNGFLPYEKRGKSLLLAGKIKEVCAEIKRSRYALIDMLQTKTYSDSLHNDAVRKLMRVEVLYYDLHTLHKKLLWELQGMHQLYVQKYSEKSKIMLDLYDQLYKSVDQHLTFLRSHGHQQSIYSANDNKVSFINIVLAVFGVLSCLWIALNHDLLSDQYGFIENEFQFILSLFLLFLVLEMARRSVGWPLPLVTLIALLYGMFGYLIPGEFGHPGIPINSFLGNLTIAETGLWGSLTNVSVTIVSIFVIFGCFLNAGEAGEGFMNIAKFFAGKLKGGAAKVSIISSALFGSISGSASANVASTGSITLPTMKKLGYPKKLAASVEAVASSGGQIMPPLMGAGAFVMVELTGIPYDEIIVAAFLPALLFFFTVWIGINFYSGIYNLKPLPEKDTPNKKLVIFTFIFFLVPFFILLFFMFSGFTPQFSASIAILLSFVLLFFNLNTKFDIKIGFDRFKKACNLCGKQISLIASIILCASLIIGVLAMTGLGIKLTSLIMSFSNNNV